jgi:hypothetical protein
MSKSILKRAAAAAAALGLLAALTSLAQAEVTQEGNLRVSFVGGISPHNLPRQGTAPVRVTLGGDIKTTDGAPPPQLRTITLAINRNGRLDYRGLPACRYHQIQPASTAEAIESCPDSLVGKGKFKANVVLPEQSPFPSAGDVVAFNGLFHGRHVLFAHVYGTAPLPQSQVLVFELGRSSGEYRTTLSAELPQVAAEWGYVSGLNLSLQRSFKHKGRTRSYISAGCPAPKGFPGSSFAFAQASFGFEDGRVLATTMTRNCGVEEKAKR